MILALRFATRNVPGYYSNYTLTTIYANLATHGHAFDPKLLGYVCPLFEIDIWSV